MLTLNLTSNDTSDIKFEVSNFPDKQHQVRILQDSFFSEGGPSTPIFIKARLDSFQDLELIICANRSLRGLGFREIHLYAPYFLGSRSDRQFQVGSNNYLKDVVCPVVNLQDFASVTVLDPHSDVLEACLNNFIKLDNKKLFNQFLKDRIEASNNKEFILVSPDAGASKKVYKLADSMGFVGDIMTCSKDRNTSGELSKTTVPLRDRHRGKDFVIIDDIFDGGATFLNIARTIREDRSFDDSKIYLIVTHGIFSKVVADLHELFEAIYCTNSYRDMDPEVCRWFKIKQLNVF